MSRRLPACTGLDVLRALERGGFYVNHVKGSHHSLRHPDRPGAPRRRARSPQGSGTRHASAASSSSASSPKRSYRTPVDGAVTVQGRGCIVHAPPLRLTKRRGRRSCRSYVWPIPPELPVVELQRAFRFPERPTSVPGNNVAPTQTVPSLVPAGGEGGC